MIIKVSNPGKRPAKSKRVRGKEEKTMAKAKKRAKTKSARKNPAPKKRARRAKSHAAPRKHARRHVRRASNPSKAHRVRRRRNPSGGKSPNVMSVAQAIGAGVATGAAVTIGNYLYNKQSGGMGKMVTYGIAALGVAAGLVVAKKDAPVGMAMAVGGAAAALVPALSQKIFESTQPKAMSAIVDMGVVESSNISALLPEPGMGAVFEDERQMGALVEMSGVTPFDGFADTPYAEGSTPFS